MMYLTAFGLTPGGSSTVDIYTQKLHRTTQSTQTIRRTTNVTLTSSYSALPDYGDHTETCNFSKLIQCAP